VARLFSPCASRGARLEPGVSSAAQAQAQERADESTTSKTAVVPWRLKRASRQWCSRQLRAPGHFERVRVVDSDVLRTCIRMGAGQEVNVCSPLEWERAILLGYDTWRVVRDAGHGAVTCDLDARTIEVRPLTGTELATHAAIATDFLAKQAEVRG
jgi:hypothetical protein